MTDTEHTGRRQLTRRGVTGALLAAAIPLPIALAGRAAAAAPAPAPGGQVRTVLPSPTGPYPVGTVSLHLVDASRPDPVAGPGHVREVMASVWYPAQDVRRFPRTPWMEAGALRALLASSGFDPGITAGPLTAGHQGAPVRRTGGRLPVVLFSHAAHDQRGENTVIVQELASHGYAVVTVDHTNDAFTQFPDGRVSVPDLDPQYALTPGDFATDIRFVLDRVEDLDAGRNPDAGHRRLPAGLRGAFDLRRVGMFGSSKGGTATARVMYDDPRVRAGLSLDGPMETQPAFTADLDRPFMMVTAEFTRAAEPAVASFWSHLRGWRLDIESAGAIHATYSDYVTLIPQLQQAAGMSDEDVWGWVGTIDPGRAVRIQQAYPRAFFDRHLRRLRHGGHLLDGPSAAFPEVTFVP